MTAKRSTPGSAGEEQLGFGGAALSTSKAAYSKICSAFGIFPVFGLVAAAMLCCFAGSRPLSAQEPSRSTASASADGVLISSAIDLLTGETVSKENRPTVSAAAQQPPPQNFIIDRIEFN